MFLMFSVLAPVSGFISHGLFKTEEKKPFCIVLQLLDKFHMVKVDKNTSIFRARKSLQWLW